MFTTTELAADALSSQLASHMKQQFGSSESHLADLISSVARLALECIGDTDALYHNVEHTMLVTLAGHDILNGRAMFSPTTPADYAHFIVACLLHDVGYVRGILNGDDAEGCVIDESGNKIRLPRGASDAALTPYHVDRSKLFALNRIAQNEAASDPTHDWNKMSSSVYHGWLSNLISYQARQEVTLLGLQQVAFPAAGGLTEKANHLDPFTDEKLHYLVKSGGFVLYSVGPNGKDDIGVFKLPAADDIAFEYP